MTETESLVQTIESQRRTIEKLEGRIRELEKGLYTCGACGKPTAKPLTIGKGIVVCSKDCRLRAARELKGA